MSAADFQAYAFDAAGRKVRSNVVRVGWAGSGITGDWAWFFSSTPGGPVARNGCTTFTANPNTATWVGNRKMGTWERAGNQITITWPDSTDTMTLSADGQTMTGTNDSGFNVQGVRGC